MSNLFLIPRSIFASVTGLALVMFLFSPNITPSLFAQDSLANPILFLLGQKDVQQELELVDFQLDAILEVQDQYQEALAEASQQIKIVLQTAIPSERESSIKKIRQHVQVLNRKFENTIRQELIPDQSYRLKQLSFQYDLHSHQNIIQGQLGSSLIEELGITYQQQDAIEEKASQAREKFYQDVSQLRKGADAEIISILEPDQIEKYRKLFGKPFDHPMPSTPDPFAEWLK